MADTTLHLGNQLQAALQPGYMFWALVITFWLVVWIMFHTEPQTIARAGHRLLTNFLIIDDTLTLLCSSPFTRLIIPSFPFAASLSLSHIHTEQMHCKPSRDSPAIIVFRSSEGQTERERERETGMERQMPAWHQAKQRLRRRRVG